MWLVVGAGLLCMLLACLPKFFDGTYTSGGGLSNVSSGIDGGGGGGAVGRNGSGVVGQLAVGSEVDGDGGSSSSATKEDTWWGDLIALGSGICLAIYFNLSHRVYLLLGEGEVPLHVAPLLSVGGAYIPTIIAAGASGGRFFPLEQHHIGPFLAPALLVGLAGSVGFFCATLASSYVPGTVVAVILTLQGAVSALMAFAAFGEVPDGYTVAAMCILLVALVASKAVPWVVEWRHGQKNLRIGVTEHNYGRRARGLAS